MKRTQLIQLRLAVHKSLTDSYVCHGMDREEASRAAFNAVRDATPAKLEKLGSLKA